MAESNEQIETVGKIWDTISTGQKISLVSCLIGLLSAIGYAGYWLGNFQTESKLLSAEAKHERELTNQKESSREVIRDLHLRLATHVWSKQSGHADLEIAEQLSLSQEAFLNEFLKASCDEPIVSPSGENWGKYRKTTFQMEDYFMKISNHSVVWEGLVWDVKDQGSTLRVSMVLKHKRPETIIADCYFIKEMNTEKNLKGLCRGNWILVQGVINDGAELVNCKMYGNGTGIPPSEMKLIAPNAKEIPAPPLNIQPISDSPKPTAGSLP